MPGMNPRTPTRRNRAATAVAAFCMLVAVMLRVVVSVMQRGYPPQVRVTPAGSWGPPPPPAHPAGAVGAVPRTSDPALRGRPEGRWRQARLAGSWGRAEKEAAR